MKPEKIKVACPHCGHVQLEPRDGYSTVCKQCQKHFRLSDVLHPQTGQTEKQHATRRVTCFQCSTLLEVAEQAESTMCKRCSAHIDLRNYSINQAVSKNFRTHGSFEIGEKGYVLNTEVEAGDAVIRGRFLGKLHAHRTLTILAPEQFKGTFKAALLIVPEGVKFHWPKPLEVQSLEIAGELVANVHIPGTVYLKATAHLFGDVEAANLVMEPGAVLVGQMKIGMGLERAAASTPPSFAVDSAPEATPAPEPETEPDTGPGSEAKAAEPTELPGLGEEPKRPAPRKRPSRSKKQT
jgi:cytoskeletal protein CcmA (bactofilin family)/ribosomal protein S27E